MLIVGQKVERLIKILLITQFVKLF